MIYLNSRCYFCRQRLFIAGHGLCCVCLSKLPRLPSCCPRCGLPAENDTDECGRCLLESPPWQSLIAFSDYCDPVRQMVIDFKFHRQPHLARILSRLWLLRWLEVKRRRNLIRADVLLSVPLHRLRRWRRGYNQSELLAQRLSYWLSCQWRPNLIVKTRATSPQHRLSAAERRNNLAGAFKLNGNVNGLNVAIIDDVITSGVTLTEISYVLLAGGAKTVQVWCLCRTL
jgi:ComF family protein